MLRLGGLGTALRNPTPTPSGPTNRPPTAPGARRPRHRVRLTSALLLAVPAVLAHELVQDFTGAPAQAGWAITGDDELFRWDSATQALAVTWDSSKPNSLFHLPLHTVLGKQDDFAVSFDLRLDQIQYGSTPGKPYTFEIAVGFLNLRQAREPGFRRGTGIDSPNLVEWDYFPDSGFGATVAGTIISTTHQWATSFNSPLELAPGVTYTVSLDYRAANQTLTLTLARPGDVQTLQPARLPAEFTDFEVDAFSVTSYSDAGQDPAFAGSVHAEGWVDNIRLRLPDPPIRRFIGAFDPEGWRASFHGWTGWRYTLEASEDLDSWSPVAPALEGTGARQSILDPRPRSPHRFYRLRAEQP